MIRRRSNWNAFTSQPLRFAETLLVTKQVLAIDAGARSLKLLLVEQKLGRHRICTQRLIDLRAEGLLSQEETANHVQAVLAELGPEPIAVAVPQHIALAQVLDLPLTATAAEVKELITRETQRLGGLSASALVHDWSPLRPFAKFQHPYWLTLSHESRVFNQLSQFKLAQEDVCEITTAASALVTAYLTCERAAHPVLLADIGATRTVLALVLDRQCIHATTHAIAGDQFTDALARDRNCSREAAETAKCSEALPLAELPELRATLDKWREESLRTGKEALDHCGLAEPDLGSIPVVLSGGAARLRGLIDYLNRHDRKPFGPWPEPARASHAVDGRIAIAYGAAIEALGHACQPGSLLPADLRRLWKKRYRTHLFQAINLALTAIVIALLMFATAQKLHLLQAKNALLGQTYAALGNVEATKAAAAQWYDRYESVRPLFARHVQTVDTLRTLALLQRVKTNDQVWFVLFADQQTYFSHSPSNLITRDDSLPPGTNAPPAKYGFVAELCLVEQGEAMRQRLSTIVAALKSDRLFVNVDSVPLDRRRNLADPKLLLPERHFALAIDCVENIFRRSARAVAPENGAEARGRVPAQAQPAPAEPLLQRNEL